MMDTDLPAEAPPRGSFLGHVNIVVLTYLADGVLAFATGILLARELGADGRGVYGLFVISAALGQLVLGFGIGNAAIYYVNKGEIAVREAVAAAHVVTGLSALVTAGVIALTAPFVEDRVLGVGVSPWLLVAGVPALLYWNLMRLILQAESRFVALGLSTLSQQALLIAAITLVVFAGEPTPHSAVLCLIGATAAAGLFSLTRVGLENVDLALLLRAPRLDILRKLARFGLQGETGNILQLLNYRLDQFIVRGYVGLAGVGIYAVSTSMTEVIFVMANSVALVLLPRLTADEDEAHWMAPLATRNTILIAAAAALVLAAIAPVLIPTAFGERFSGSVQPLWLLLPGTVALTGSKVLTSYIFSKGRPLVNTGITAASLVVTLIADLVFIPIFDVNGAAIASSLAYSAHFAVALFAYSRISGRSPLVALVPLREDAQLYFDARRTIWQRLFGSRAVAETERTP